MGCICKYFMKLEDLYDMKIEKEILQAIISKMPNVPPEAGGIIGGREECIRIWEYDEGKQKCGCIYEPNVEYLNAVIEEWNAKGYSFMGIFHVHFGGAANLSAGDIEYIKKIMRAMSPMITRLYFPIVLKPENVVYFYLVHMNENKLEVIRDEVLLV